MIEPNGELQLWSVPPVWPGETFICIGGGPSLTQEQVDECKENARIIVINDSYRLAPSADILYASDSRWWVWHDYVPEFLGVRVGLGWNGTTGACFPGWDKIPSNIRVLAATGTIGLERDPRGLRHGYNSGYQAINLAVHLGAKRIVLLGYDMKAKDGKNHWFGEHPDRVPAPPYDLMLPAFESLIEPLAELEVEVMNCTPDSELKTFPSVGLEEAV